MSTLKDLLKGVPVEWKALGELAILKRGRVMSKNYLIENIGSYPVYSSQTANDGKIGEIKTFDFDGEFLTWTTDGANAGTIFYRKGKFSITNVCGLVEAKTTTSLNYKFLYYWLNIESKNHVYAGMGNPKLMSHQMEKIQIPIPYPNDPEKSLAIQQEIVRVLDGLTEQNKALTSALAQEIDQRKKQYEYYREELFRFEGKEVEWKTLGEVILKSYSGSTPRAGEKKYYQNGSIPWLRTQEVKFSEITGTEIKITEAALNETAVKWIPANCVIIAISGATAGRSAINKIPLTTNQHCLCLDIDKDIAYYKYIFYWMSKNYDYLKSLGRGARGDLNASIIKSFAVPVPSILEQERIVRLLDQFDEATKNIVAQLEKEIELRNKQYEYYRNELLGFRS